ncbi:hypothetical protein DE146DRAFT_435578 [Phaeosphaeria sp. MPI-PUGE-AT-0046c]|nr:hypothetical protein DE146DRAFT_435578 [Phaeosphaeria sp. MPI-PUGE-AT-0046c]
MIAILPIVLLALVSSATARPKLQRRGLPGAVYTCDSSDFRGNCQWNPPADRCFIQGPAGSGVVSMGPDPDGSCILYSKFDCTGDEVRTIRFPGIAGGLPNFAAFKCSANQQARADVTAGLAVKVLDPTADPRLAGGVGSAERKEHLEEITQMEEDGFSQGLIGLNKGVYY